MKKEYFDLDRNEERLEWILLGIAIVTFTVIGFGVYFQSRQIDHDNFLMPALFICCSAFFALYSMNAFQKANLTSKWTPAYIFAILLFFTKKLSHLSPEKSKIRVCRILGGIAAIASLASLIAAIHSIVKSL